MKIYSVKRFIFGTLGLAMSLFGFVLIAVKGFHLKLLILLPIIFILSLLEIRKSLSKAKVLQANIEKQDERNQLVDIKSRALSFRIVQISIMVLKVSLLVLFGITREPTLVWVILAISLLFIICFVSELSSTLYYDKRL